jgi:uncharacterized membrane protein
MDGFEKQDDRGTERLAKALGWFGVGLGVAEIAASRSLGRAIGVPPQPRLFPALGMRELISGIGILAQRRPAGWVWSRVAGDAIDFALLGAAATSDRSDAGRLRVASSALAAVTLLDLICAVCLSRQPSQEIKRIVQTITINRSREELFAFWRNLENLPRVMGDIETVRQTGPNHSHWVVRGPGGKKLQWDAEVTDEQPNEYISWRAGANHVLNHRGTVRFVTAPGDRGTIVRVEMSYRPLGGTVRRGLLKIFGQAPEDKIQLDLYRMKQMVETGVVMTTKGQPAARPSSTSTLYDWGTTRG